MVTTKMIQAAERFRPLMQDPRSRAALDAVSTGAPADVLAADRAWDSAARRANSDVRLLPHQLAAHLAWHLVSPGADEAGVAHLCIRIVEERARAGARFWEYVQHPIDAEFNARAALARREEREMQVRMGLRMQGCA